MKISAARLCIFGSRESGHFQLSRNFCPSAWSPVRPGSIPSLGQFLWRKGHKGTSWWTNDALIKNYHPTTTKGSPAWPVSRFLSFSPVRLPLVSQIHPLSLFIESTLFLSASLFISTESSSKLRFRCGEEWWWTEEGTWRTN